MEFLFLGDISKKEALKYDIRVLTSISYQYLLLLLLLFVDSLSSMTTATSVKFLGDEAMYSYIGGLWSQPGRGNPSHRLDTSDRGRGGGRGEGHVDWLVSLSFACSAFVFGCVGTFILWVYGTFIIMNQVSPRSLKIVCQMLWSPTLRRRCWSRSDRLWGNLCSAYAGLLL